MATLEQPTPDAYQFRDIDNERIFDVMIDDIPTPWPQVGPLRAILIWHSEDNMFSLDATTARQVGEALIALSKKL